MTETMSPDDQRRWDAFSSDISALVERAAAESDWESAHKICEQILRRLRAAAKQSKTPSPWLSLFQARAILFWGLNSGAILGKTWEVTRYNEAIRILRSMLERQRFDCLAESHKTLAVALMSRAFANRTITRGCPPPEVIDDYEEVIRILSGLVEKLGADCLPDWRRTLADALQYSDTAEKEALGDSVKRIDELVEEIRALWTLIEALGADSLPHRCETFADALLNSRAIRELSPAKTIKDHDEAINILRSFVKARGPHCPPEWRKNLATSLLKRAAAKESRRGYGPLETIEDYDDAIEILRNLLETPGTKYPTDWLKVLAEALLDRGVLKMDEPSYGALAAIGDFDEVVFILSAAIEAHNADCPPDWRYLLAGTIMNRGDAKQSAPGFVWSSAVEDYDETIAILRALMQTLGANCSPNWRTTLADALMKRGDAKQTTRLGNSIEDYNEAISVLRANIEAVGGNCPAEWRAKLALAFMNRSVAQNNASDFGPMVAIEDCNEAIAIWRALVGTLVVDCPPNWRINLAATLMNREIAKRLEPRFGSPLATEDVDEAIAILRALVETSGADCSQDLSITLARALMSRGRAKQDTCPLNSIEDYDEAIDVLHTDIEAYGTNCPPDRLQTLAEAYLSRGASRQIAHGYGTLEAIEDYDEAISLLHTIIEAIGTDCPSHWRESLANAFTNRGVVKKHLTQYGPHKAIEDYDEAIRILHSSIETIDADCSQEVSMSLFAALVFRGDAKVLAPDYGPIKAIEDYEAALELKRDSRSRLGKPWWLRACLMLSKLHVELGQISRAIAVLQLGASWRSEGFAAAVTRPEQKDHIEYGAEIAKLGAVLLAQTGRYDEAILFLETNRALFLKEALLRDPHALGLRIGKATANKISGLIAGQLKLRLMLDYADAARRRGETPAGTDELRSRLIQKTRQLREAVAEIDGGKLARTPSIESLRALAPENGALVVPIASSIGTVVLLLTQDRPIQALHLDYLARDDVEAWVDKLLSAERDYAETLDAAPLAALMADHLPAYWDKLIAPIEAALESLGLSADAPVTIVTQGAFDLLPLHAACRSHDGRMRHWIEDRVIRYAPSMAALEIMHRRKAERGRTPARLAGFFNATGDLPRTEDSELEALHALPWAASHDCNGFQTASRDRAMRLLRGRASFTHLHFAMHSTFDPLAPEASGLVFSDGVLSVADLLAIPARPDLECVSLASCRSGRSDNSADECIGPVLAFIQAGAGAVLSALYVLSDEGAAGLAPSIYRQLLEQRGSDAGYGLAEALRDTFLDRLKHQESDEITPALLDCIALKAACG